MALPKKKSRKLTLGNTVYRYMISKPRQTRDKSSDNAQLQLSLTVEQADVKGSQLRVRFQARSSLAMPSQNARDAQPTIMITPRHVRQVIDYALQHGWQPTQKAAHFIISLGSELFPQVLRPMVED